MIQPYGYYNPTTYSAYNPYQQQQIQQHQQSSTIQWVQGLAGAQAFTLGAGQSVLLMDSESNVFYIKSTDPSGMPLPLRVFDYTERTAQNAQTAPQTAGIDTSTFVTHEELEARLAALSAPVAAKKTTTKKAEVENG